MEENNLVPNTNDAPQLQPNIPVSPPVQPPIVAQAPQATQSVNTPAVLILQWLTYAFWGWTILAMSFLTSIVLATFILGTDASTYSPYVVAAVVVLLPISAITDKFYSKKEPVKKTGGATIIMVIHAVLFALFCIGSLIAIVFSIISYFTNSGGSSNTTVALLSAIIIMLLYASIFLRVLTPYKPTWLHKAFMFYMIIVVGIMVVLGIAGPTYQASVTKNDKLIENNLSSLTTSIDSYANSHNKLPQSLNQLSLSGDTATMVNKNLVTYIPDTQAAVYPDQSNSQNYYYQTPTYYYQLCVTYRKSSGTGTNPSSYQNANNGYSNYIDSSSHPAGKDCYNVATQ